MSWWFLNLSFMATSPCSVRISSSVVMCQSASGHQLQLSRCHPESRCPVRSSYNCLQSHETWLQSSCDAWRFVTSASPLIRSHTEIVPWFYFWQLPKPGTYHVSLLYRERLTQLSTSSPSTVFLFSPVLFQEGKKKTKNFLPILVLILIFSFFLFSNKYWELTMCQILL